MARFVLRERRRGLTVCRLLLRHLFQTAHSRSRGAFYFRRRKAWVTPATRLSGNAQLSLSCPMHAANKTNSAQKMSPPGVKQAADGETRAANIKKKLMKNKLSVEAAAPANADQRSSKQRAFAKHCANRELPTQKVLDFLRAQLPQQYELAEIVGRWIWLEFDGQHAAANILWRLGFHWNQRRSVWQHPCGACAPFASHPADPRTKYGSYFAADVKPA